MAIAAWSWSCASYTALDDTARKAIQQRHVGKIVELRHSQYFGDLYDDNERWLLSALPFADTYHLIDLHGLPITPKKQRGLLPAGTQLSIVAVHFPTATTVATRMLTTPRYSPWVVVRPVAVPTPLGTQARDLIIVLPDSLPDEATTEAALTSELAPQGEVTGWLASVRPTVQVAIAHKDIIAGMNLQELTASQGDASHWFVDRTADGRTARVAWYPHHEVWLIGDAVQEIRASRPLD
jgi:hypothetical protein